MIHLTSTDFHQNIFSDFSKLRKQRNLNQIPLRFRKPERFVKTVSEGLRKDIETVITAMEATTEIAIINAMNVNQVVKKRGLTFFN